MGLRIVSRPAPPAELLSPHHRRKNISPRGVKSLKNVLVSSYTADAKDGADKIAVVCLESSAEVGGSLKVFPKVEKGEAELLATCMESKVGEVFLKSHIKSSAADCIATVMPALSPDRAKQLGVYWQTPEQLAAEFPHGN